MKDLSSNLLKAVYDIAVAAANLTVNSSCHWHYYQEELDSQLDILKRYQDDNE